MSEWPIKKISEVCEVVNGGTPKTKVSEYWKGEHAWITPAEMGKRLSYYVDSTARSITDLGLDNSSAKLIPPNSVILSSRAPIGHVVINTIAMAFNQGCRGLVPSDCLDSVFLANYLTANVQTLNDLGTGATFKELSSGKLKAFEIPLPPLAEQKRIVSILDEAFAAIAKAKENAERNLANAKELFESYLNKVFTEKGEGWEEASLEILGRTQTGSTPKKANADHYGDFIPFIKPADFRSNGTLSFGESGLSKEGLENAREVPAGSALMVCIGATIGKSGFCESAITTNQQINAFIPNEKIDYRFAYYAFITRAFQREVRRNSGQATLPIINKSKWSRLTVRFPDRDKQIRIVETLEDIKERQLCFESVLNGKLANLDELKQSILQKAFTGQLTSKSPELESI